MTVATGPRPTSRFASSTVPGRATRRARDQLLELGDDGDLLEQLVDADVLRAPRSRRTTVSPPHFSGTRPCWESCSSTRSGFASGAVHLVDRDDDRHVGGLGVVDRLDRLGHHAVVGGDDEHDDVGDLRAARAHGREGLVAGRVDERDRVAVPLDPVGADVLGDPAGLARDDVRRADPVEQQRLAVVDVAHDRDDRRAGRGLDRVELLVLLEVLARGARPPAPRRGRRGAPSRRARRRTARSCRRSAPGCPSRSRPAGRGSG